MKTKNPTIVSVSVNRVDPREFEARNIVTWLNTLPIKAVHDQLTFRLNLGAHGDTKQAITKLKSLAAYHFDVTVPGGGLDFMRVYNADGFYFVTYAEYIHPFENALGEPDGDHYNSLINQRYEHVVDAFKSFQFRIESETPFKPAEV